MCIGLATQDTAENALAELGMDKIRFTGPVFHGDTLYAYSEVLGEDGRRPRRRRRRRASSTRASTRTTSIVFEGERTVLIKRRSHWGDK